MDMAPFVRVVLIGCIAVIVVASLERMRKTPGAHVDLLSFQSLVRSSVYSVSALVVFGFAVSVFFSLRTHIPALIEFFGSDQVSSVTGDDLIARMIEKITSAEGRDAVAPAAVLALIALFGGFKIPILNKADEKYRRWLSSIDFRQREAEQIEILLRRSDFSPPEGERRANREKLHQFEFYVEESPFDPESGVIGLWRKVAGLLRLVDYWQGQYRGFLSSSQKAVIAEIRDLDERKTKMALAIVRIMMSIRDSDGEEVQGPELKRLEAVPHQDRPGIAALEEAVEEHLAARVSTGEAGAVRIEMHELDGYIKQIEGYFEIEYRILLDKLVALVAEAVCLNRRSTSLFVEELHTVGFVEMGEYVRFGVEKIFVFALVLFVALALGFAGMDILLDQVTRMEITKIFLIFFVYLAAVICAIGFGCNRTVAEKPFTPWGEYLKASLATLVAFVMIHAANYTFSQVPEPTLLAYFGKKWHWAFFPFAATLSICWRGGHREPAAAANQAPWIERVKDGGIVAGAMALAGLLVLWGMQYSDPVMFQRFFPEDQLNLTMIIAMEALSSFIGFVLGLAVLSDMRQTNTYLAEIFGPKALTHAG